jgi:hypothetical protein
MDGKVRVEINRGPSLPFMLEEIPRLYQAARRNHRISVVCFVVQIGALIYTVAQIIGGN